MTELLNPIAYFPGAAPEVALAHCLNRRFKQVDCTRCQENCPVQAIQLVDQLPVLDEDACVRCGTCLHECPNEVFGEDSRLEQRMVKAAAVLPDEPFAVVCPLHPTPSLTCAPVSTILRHTRCLAGLGVADLLALTPDGQRTVWLEDSACAECPLAAIQAHVIERAASARVLLESCGRPGSVQCTSSRADAESSTPVKRAVIDGSQPKLSRRGLFTSFLPAGPANTIVEEPPDPEPTRWSQGKRLPPLRRTLLRALRRWKNPAPHAKTPVRGIQVQAQHCSACELCARFCPTDALQFTKGEGTFALHVEPARCIDCSICVRACPENAIAVGDSVSLSALLAEPVPAAEGPLQPCGRCGALTSPMSSHGQPLCHSCRTHTLEVRPLHDGAGLIADLFRREQSLSSVNTQGETTNS